MKLKTVNHIQLEIVTVIDTPSHLEKEEIASFIFNNQKEIKESKEDVFRCIEFAFGQFKHSGGFVVLARDTQKMNNPVVGCAVVNQTTMVGYVSENILVYLTTHGDYKEREINKSLLEQTLHFAKGNIDVLVNLNNENKNLLSEYGFTHSYHLYRINRN
ncbi:MAG: GNAT family N-acetyltransferase [Bacteroidia bacterium]|nr:GNAT family N-acetyltransferase [Bacteroidia bacterium]